MKKSEPLMRAYRGGMTPESKERVLSRAIDRPDFPGTIGTIRDLFEKGTRNDLMIAISKMRMEYYSYSPAFYAFNQNLLTLDTLTRRHFEKMGWEIDHLETRSFRTEHMGGTVAFSVAVHLINGSKMSKPFVRRYSITTRRVP